LETLKLKANDQTMFVCVGKLVQLGDQKFAKHLMRTAYNNLIKRKNFTIFATVSKLVQFIETSMGLGNEDA